jgi:hypothetical protein
MIFNLIIFKLNNLKDNKYKLTYWKYLILYYFEKNHYLINALYKMSYNSILWTLLLPVAVAP